MNTAIVLAAGKGTRMKTELPKCAFPILSKPMISYVIDSLDPTIFDKIVVVVGHKKEIIKDILEDRVIYAEQNEQLGTAHACLMAKELLKNDTGKTIILPGDMPLINQDVIAKAMARHQYRRHDLTIVSVEVEHPHGYGRIVRDLEGVVEGIVEENEATSLQKQIKEINTGVYVVKTQLLFETLAKVNNENNKKEYYLTDIVKIIRDEGYVIGTYHVEDPSITTGVNDLYALSMVEATLRLNINRQHMLQGTQMINPETITIGEEVIIEPGVTIYPNTYVTGQSVLKKGARVGPNTEVHNSIIGENVWCRHSMIYQSTIHENSVVGPFAHLRDGAEIGANNRIGNFVEIKQSSTGKDTKASHLAYIGDATVGEHVNFGCGSITVNYDGKKKHRTTIGNNVFIGCNTNLIAPIILEDDSYTAAGSTVTEFVPKGSLAIARAAQVNKQDYFQKKNGNQKKEE